VLLLVLVLVLVLVPVLLLLVMMMMMSWSLRRERRSSFSAGPQQGYGCTMRDCFAVPHHEQPRSFQRRFVSTSSSSAQARSLSVTTRMPGLCSSITTTTSASGPNPVPVTQQPLLSQEFAAFPPRELCELAARGGVGDAREVACDEMGEGGVGCEEGVGYDEVWWLEWSIV
jgi:hypothetical protein